MIYLEAFSKVLPVILLFILGAFLRRTRFPGRKHGRRSEEAGRQHHPAGGAVPGVCGGATLKARHLAIVALVFAGCVLALLAGRLIGRAGWGCRSPYFPTLMTGFEAGMMGYAIFAAVYGTANIFNFAVVDLGQVVFVFFVLVPFVQRLSTGAISFGQTLVGFLRTPVIVAIFLGIVFNRLGLDRTLRAWPPTDAIFRHVGALGGGHDAADRAGDRLRGALAARRRCSSRPKPSRCACFCGRRSGC